jgi:hypothetical protein
VARYTSNSKLSAWPLHGYILKHAFLIDSSVGMALGYGLDDRGSGFRFSTETGNFSLPPRPERLWDPPSLLSNGYRGGSFPGAKAAGA